jgi:PelA/Pel-15E family pectate lyase
MKKIVSLLFFALLVTTVFGQDKTTSNRVKATMKAATHFMMDKVSDQGGFVWQYLPDLSRSWGELEARRSMVWIQPSGTPTVGLVLVDAFEATKDPYYLKAALKVAKTLIKGQLPCGGWNYAFDLNGEDSLKTWYETVGKNAWRLEEFQHYYGNATFDDGGTIESGLFLLRLNAHSKDKTVLKALEKVIGLVLESQYPNGGWPQRYPLMKGFSKNGIPDYTGYITLNDDVLHKNIEFLLTCSERLHRPELRAKAIKAMHCCRDLQQKGAYPGWSDQYTLDGKPAQARSYEPRAINTATTVKCVQLMLEFYVTTGDSTFLTGIPAALDFVESQRLSDSVVAQSGKHFRGSETFMTPRFVDPVNGLPLYVHRKGSNVVNGTYYVDQDIRHTIVHYSSQAMFDLKPIREAFSRKKVAEIEDERSSSFGRMPVERVLSSFDAKGYWPSLLTTNSNPYIGAGPASGSEDLSYAETMAGDLYDTSCNTVRSTLTCISIRTYTMNMQRLIRYIENK